MILKHFSVMPNLSNDSNRPRPMSRAERDARKPLPLEQRVDAIQDRVTKRVHVRSVRIIRRKQDD